MTPDQLTPEQRYLYEERWRIRFWDGGMEEEAAKAAALAEVLDQPSLFSGCKSLKTW